MSTAAAGCPVCGGQLAVPATGRRPVYCGKPCRQAAHRARQAAARAAESAGWLRRELAGSGGWRAGVEYDLGLPVLRFLDAVAQVHDHPWPSEDGVASGWEDDVVRHADEVRRLASRAADLAAAHARAATDYETARAVLRRAPAPDPDGDETGSVPSPLEQLPIARRNQAAPTPAIKIVSKPPDGPR